MKTYQISEISKIAGVSKRTLHYYDEVGLLVPITDELSGYRLYCDDDLVRLQQILFFKELGFKLEEIKNILNSESFDRLSALKKQKELMDLKVKRYFEIIDTIDEAIASIEGGNHMSGENMFKALDINEIEEHKKKYEKEVREKYDEDLVKESNRRTSKYSQDDWNMIQKEAHDIFISIADGMSKGPEDAIVQENVKKYHEHIDKYYYPCSIEIFRGLGIMYVEDERFTKYYEDIKVGLAAFMRDAMEYYSSNITK